MTAEQASEDRRSIRYIVAGSAAELAGKLEAAETARALSPQRPGIIEGRVGDALDASL